MAGRKTLAMTERQFAVLEMLWERGPLTVREIKDSWPGGDEVPYTTILGLLQTMEKAGLVDHDKEDAAHRYRPTMGRHEATRNLLTDFARRFFGGSARRLALGLVEADELSAEDLRELETRLRSKAKPPKAREPGTEAGP